ncbi:hypothetical protein E2C01_047311 [Portunus trituberculatus]|uniref:Uncharacterized protein n=1 Tax=Portunus trituberculatus TaxID=210409 RepID=A0A5B7G0S8_PORTR|nr:hypothetical protein [Portunus trituberculatus]
MVQEGWSASHALKATTSITTLTIPLPHNLPLRVSAATVLDFANNHDRGWRNTASKGCQERFLHAATTSPCRDVLPPHTL